MESLPSNNVNHGSSKFISEETAGAQPISSTSPPSPTPLNIITTSNQLLLPRFASEALSPVSPSDFGQFLRQNTLFSSAPEEVLEKLALGVHLRHFQSGDTIIREGELAKALFFVVKGTVTVVSADAECVFAELSRGQFFGEIGALFEVPRTANVLAKTRSLVASLTRVQLDHIMDAFPDISDAIRLEAIERFVEQTAQRNLRSKSLGAEQSNSFLVANFAQIPQYLRLAESLLSELISMNLPKRTFKKDEPILMIGAIPDFLSIVLSGSVSILEGNGKQERLSAGSIIGETFLLEQIPTYATFRADEETDIYAIPSPSLSTLLRQIPILQEKLLKAARRGFQLSRLVGELNRESYRLKDEFVCYSSHLNNDITVQEIVPSPRVRTRLTATSSTDQRKSFIFEEVQLLALSSVRPAEVTVTQAFSAEEEAPDPFVRDVPVESQAAVIEEVSVKEEKGHEETDTTSVLPPPVPRAPRFGHITALEPSRRRASIAVWSDPKLAAIASQKPVANGNTVSTPSRFQNAVQGADLADLMDPQTCETRPQLNPLMQDNILRHLFKYLSFIQKWKLRAVHPLWIRTFQEADQDLELVDLSSCHKSVDDSVVATVTAFCGGKLRSLSLRNCWRVGNLGLANIGTNSANLKTLDLCGCWDVADDGLFSLSPCTQLQSIDLSNCKKVTDAGLRSLLTNCPDFRDLLLSYCKGTTDALMGYLASLSPKLRRLNLQRCVGITDQGFGFFRPVPHVKLQELILSDCSFLTDEAVESIATSFPNLRVLNISFCCALSANAVQKLTTACRMMKTLDISFCGNAVTDESITWMAREWSCLERLSIRGCLQASDVGLQALIQHALCLQTLNITNCKNISAEMRSKLPSHWKLLGAQTPVVESIGLHGGEVYGSHHLRRNTA